MHWKDQATPRAREAWRPNRPETTDPVTLRNRYPIGSLLLKQYGSRGLQVGLVVNHTAKGWPRCVLAPFSGGGFFVWRIVAVDPAKIVRALTETPRGVGPVPRVVDALASHNERRVQRALSRERARQRREAL